VTSPLYTTEILRLAASLPVEKRLEAPSGSGEKRSATCGSLIRAEVAVDGGGRVQALSQRVQACAFGQASAALLQAYAIGRSGDELAQARSDLAAWLGGEGVGAGVFAVLAPARSKAGRHGAILLPLDALLAALEDAGR